MKFVIPELGDRFRLIQDADIDLKNAGVNTKILYATPGIQEQIEANAKLRPRYDPSDEYWQALEDYENILYRIFLPKDTILSVARVYIRKGASDFSSVTFNILECPRKIYALKKAGGTWNSGVRNFFLNLHQLDCLEFEPID